MQLKIYSCLNQQVYTTNFQNNLDKANNGLHKEQISFGDLSQINLLKLNTLYAEFHVIECNVAQIIVRAISGALGGKKNEHIENLSNVLQNIDNCVKNNFSKEQLDTNPELNNAVLEAKNNVISRIIDIMNTIKGE